jgi:peptidyl-prolyl cis-trans isomerase SurA
MRFAVRGLLLGLFAIFSISVAGAQSVQRIAAIVNDDIISGYDVEQRIKLVMASTRVDDNQDTRRRLRGQVLRNLIDETLQIQEARRFGISVDQSDYERAYRYIEQQNNVPVGQIDRFLAQAGIPKDALEQQMEAEIAWSKLVRRRISPNVQIGDEEVTEVLDRLRANAGKTEYRISEIFLPIDSPEQDEETRRAALRLLEQLRDGAAFSAIARQFSRGATAATGGAVGWVQPGQLADEQEDALSAMGLNEVSRPIRASGGYYLLKLHERRKISGDPELDATLELKQLMVPLAADASDADRETQLTLAQSLRTGIKGCDQIEPKAKEQKLNSYADLGTLRLREMPPNIQNAVKDLEVGTFSDPIKVDNGLLLLMVCKRNEPKSSLPNREAIQKTLEQRRLGMLAQRYMRDLRRDAVVELR